MKKAVIVLLAIMGTVSLSAQSTNEAYRNYIEKYKQFAIESKQKFGIPAAITMAQGLLESAAGESRLAKECNNHFGIKCGSSWYGQTMTQDDDQKGECFRCYATAQASFDDHSEFLKRQRYAFLFDYEVTDYVSWAKGLSTAGYATDPKYPSKLITIIENYELFKLDGGKNLHASETAATSGTTSKASETKKDEKKDADKTVTKKDTSKKSSTTKKDKTSKSSSKSSDKAATSEETEKKATEIAQKEQTTDQLFGYVVRYNNGLRCIYITGDDTYKKVSKAVNISVDRLLYLNDMPKAEKLEAGDIVYLHLKKTHADKTAPAAYTVKSGDSMHSIAQTFGITLKALYRMNKLNYGTPARAGQQLKLRK